MWGAAPRPARDFRPLTPLLAVFGMFFKRHAEALARYAEMGEDGEESFFLDGMYVVEKSPCLLAFETAEGLFENPNVSRLKRGQGDSVPLWGVGQSPTKTIQYR